MDRTRAQDILTAADTAERENRWNPSDDARSALNALCQSLCISVQAGQPTLSAINERLIVSNARLVQSILHADYRACRIACPSLADIRLFGEPVNNVIEITIPRRPALARAA